MKLRNVRFWQQDSPGGTDAGTDVISQTFGGIERSARPDLGDMEAAAKAAEQASQTTPEVEPLEKTETPPKEAAPEEASQPNGETQEEVSGEPKEAAPEKATAEDAQKTEESHEPPGEDHETGLEKILAKYQGKPEAAAKDIRELQRLQNKTAEERNILTERLEKVYAHFNFNEKGEPVLKPEAAAKALAAQRGQRPTQPEEIPESAVRESIEEAHRKVLTESIAPDDVDEVLQGMKPLIDQQVKEKMAVIKTQQEAVRIGMHAQLGDHISRFFVANPEHKENLPEISAFYEKMPEEVRTRAILEGHIPIDFVAKAVFMEKNVRKDLRSAFEKGVEVGMKRVEAQGAGSTGGGSKSVRRTGDQQDDDAAFKKAVLGAGIGPGIESLLEGR